MQPIEEPSPEELDAMDPVDRIRRLEELEVRTLRERRRITDLQRSQLKGVVALIVLIVIVATFFGKGISHNSHKAVTASGHAREAAQKANGAASAAGAAARAAAVAEGNLRAYEIASCHRGNERTVADNISQRADWEFFTTTSRLLRASLSRPQPDEAALSQSERAQRREQTEQFVSGLEADAEGKVWHHLIENCRFAVDHPERYKLPPPVAFSRELPPKGALHIARGE
jgi:hypothetical protein